MLKFPRKVERKKGKETEGKRRKGDMTGQKFRKGRKGRNEI